MNSLNCSQTVSVSMTTFCDSQHSPIRLPRAGTANILLLIFTPLLGRSFIPPSAQGFRIKLTRERAVTNK